MPCVVAFIVLAFLSIFSVKYRAFAKEAFDCVFRRVTFRACQTSFNEKIKAIISSWFLKRSEKIGRFIFRRFEILNWIFVILFLISGFYTARSIYFYAKFGSCNPKESQTCLISEITPPTPTPKCKQ
jgi:hypothetical protein